MNPPETRLLDADGLADLTKKLARRIVEVRDQTVPLALVGIRTRGHPIASRLAGEIKRLVGLEVPVGALDITLYRDDLEGHTRWPVLRGTEIAFPVDGTEIVLVDDVLFTGRTIRAALNSVCDLGRPARIRLAVLVDRGHRELPIDADFVGLDIATTRAEQIRVRLQPLDPHDEILRVAPAPTT